VAGAKYVISVAKDFIGATKEILAW
jgi:hypothetical protein